MKTDIYKQVADKLIAAIEAGLASGNKWAVPWRQTGASGRPVNVTTHRAYRGINVPLLWAAADQAGYESAGWASFNQWRAAGANVRKGEKGTLIVFYKSLQVESRETPGQTVTIPLLRTSYVFNTAQVDGGPKPQPTGPTLPRIDQVDEMIRQLSAVVIHGSDSAYYRPSTDQIVMPALEQFKGGPDEQREAYYATLLHELVHWTGHKSRLDRLNNYVGEGRAFEELVAELGAAFLCAELGVSNEPRADHGHYLASWLKVLKSDPKAIFKAASTAEKACDHLRGALLAEAAEAG